jgi:hypothetical protein
MEGGRDEAGDLKKDKIRNERRKVKKCRKISHFCKACEKELKFS